MTASPTTTGGAPGGPRNGTRSPQEPAFSEAKKALPGDDDVVEKGDAQKLASAHEAPRRVPVVDRRRAVTRGMVVLCVVKNYVKQPGLGHHCPVERACLLCRAASPPLHITPYGRSFAGTLLKHRPNRTKGARGAFLKQLRLIRVRKSLLP